MKEKQQGTGKKVHIKSIKEIAKKVCKKGSKELGKKV